MGGINPGRQQVQHPRERAAVGAGLPVLRTRTGGTAAHRATARPTMGGVFEAVDVPAVLSDDSAQAEWVVLAEDERFEIVVDDGFVDSADIL